MMDKIKLCKNPDATLKNFISWELYHFPIEIGWYHTGFFTYTCLDFENDTREEMLETLAKHFGLWENNREFLCLVLREEKARMIWICSLLRLKCKNGAGFKVERTDRQWCTSCSPLSDRNDLQARQKIEFIRLHVV